MSVLKRLSLGSLTDEKKENLVTALYVGTLFILIALIYFIHLPNSLWNDIVYFFSTLTLSVVPGTGVSLPAPLNPAAHLQLYAAAFQFCMGIGVLEISILVLRVYWHSPVSRKAETIENIVFWLGTGFLVAGYLYNITMASEWFVFWAALILLLGLSLIVRAVILIISARL